MRLAKDFGDFLERTVGHYGYLIGTRGEKCSQKLIDRSWNIFTSYRANIERYAKQWLTGNPDEKASEQESKEWKVVDCMGWFEAFNNGGDIGKPLSSFVHPDVSTGTVYALAQSMGLPNGKISTIPKDCPYPIFVGYTGHVGFYHKGYTYQAAGHKSGTVKDKLTSTVYNKAWEFWYVCPYLDYQGWFGGGTVERRNLRKTSPTMKGEDVLEFQRSANIIINAGLVEDGSYGGASERAAIALQAFLGLDQDGVVGPKTWAAIDNALKETCDSETEALLAEIAQLKKELSAAQTAKTKAEQDRAAAERAKLLAEERFKIITDALNVLKQY